MGYLIVFSMLLLGNCSYATDLLKDGLHQSQRVFRDIKHCGYDELIVMYSADETKDHEDEAIFSLKSQLRKENNPSVLELIGLLYEQKCDYKNSIHYFLESIKLNKRIFRGMDISHLPVFEAFERVKAYIE